MPASPSDACRLASLFSELRRLSCRSLSVGDRSCVRSNLKRCFSRQLFFFIFLYLTPSHKGRYLSMGSWGPFCATRLAFKPEFQPGGEWRITVDEHELFHGTLAS